jgi:hypothetical protein
MYDVVTNQRDGPNKFVINDVEDVLQNSGGHDLNVLTNN